MPNPMADVATRSGGWWIAVVLATLALAVTGWITVMSLSGDGSLPGCGGEAGCGAVLATKWSKFLGLPVSGLAAGLYVVVLVTLLTQKKLGGILLSAAAAAIVGAAVWFIYLQVVEVQALCKFCLASHALGLGFAAAVLLAGKNRALVPGLIVGVLATATLAGVQLTSEEKVFIVEDGGGTQAGETLTLLDGQLTLNLAEEMVVGDPASDRLLVKMADYNCPHCRHAHEVIREVLPTARVVLLPVPLNPACNAYQAELPKEQFEHSCELARLAVAVHRLDPTKLEAYDTWAYGEGWPHTADQGRAFAESLVDPDALAAALEDPEIDALIVRNTDAWGQAKDAELIGGLPVHLVPGGGLTYGGVGDGTGLVQLLDGVHHSQETSQTPDEETQP